jgi:hypothetical protein
MSLSAKSPLSTQTEMFAPDAWNNARKHIAFAVFWNAFTGFWINANVYGEHPEMARWQGWLFLTPFIIVGIVLIALTVDDDSREGEADQGTANRVTDYHYY